MTGASALFPEGSSAVTNGRGTAHVLAKANTIPGGFLVTASVPNAVSNSFELRNLTPSDVAPALPGASGFVAAAPNPFNPSTELSFDLAREGTVRLDIVDLQGRHVRTLIADEWFGAGRQTVRWDGRDQRSVVAASGIYHCLLQTADVVDVLPVVLLK
jgi:hypothetical protein